MVNVKAMRTMRTMLAFVALIFVLTACAPQEFSPSEKAIYTTVRSLQGAKELRVTALKTIGGLYKDGTLTDVEFKEKVIEIGDMLQDAINFTSLALEAYYVASTDENKNDLQVKVLMYQKILGEFTDLVMPYVLEHVAK